MASNSIINYMKNLGESVKFAAIEHVKEQMPITANFVEENKDTFNEMYKSVTSMRMNLPKMSRVEDNSLFKKANQAFNNIKTDLASGKFYHPEREDPMAVMSAVGSMLGGEFMDELNSIFSGNFGFEEDENGEFIDPKNRPEMMVTKGDALVATALYSSQKTHTNCIGNLMTKLHEHGNQASRAMFTMQLAQSQKHIGVVQAGFNLMSQGFNHIIEFNNQIVKTHVDNSQKFYENTSKVLNESNAILKSIHEIQSTVYKTEHTKSGNLDDDPTKGSNAIDFNSLFKNGFNLQTYKRLVDMNYKKSPTGMMYGLLINLPSLMSNYFENPLHHMTKMIISGVIGDQINNALSNLDKTLSNFASNTLARLYNFSKRNKDTLLGKIAGNFGYKEQEMKLSQVDTSKYEKGAMSWNGKAQKYLTNVIPSYLARIESSLTGKGERYFDADKGKWTSGKSILSSVTNLRNEAINTSTRDLDPILQSFKASFADLSEKDSEKLDSIFRAIKESSFNFGDMTKDYIDYLKKEGKQYGLSEGEAQYAAALVNQMDPSIRAQITTNVGSNKVRLNQQLSNLSNGAPQEYLLTGALNGMVGDVKKKGANGFSTSGSLNAVQIPLTELEDHRGHTLYDYQYMILQQLYNMDGLGGGSGGPTGGGPRRGRKGRRSGGKGSFDQYLNQNRGNRRKAIASKKQKESSTVDHFSRMNNALLNEEIDQELLDKGKYMYDILSNEEKKAYKEELKKMADFYDDPSYLDIIKEIDILEEYNKKFAAKGATGQEGGKTSMKQISISSILNDPSRIDSKEYHEALQKSTQNMATVSKNYKDANYDTTMFDIWGGKRDIRKYHQLPEGVNPEDSILKQLLQANDLGAKMDVMRHNLDALVDSPRILMSSAIAKADEAIYDVLFGRDVGEVDPATGRPIKGIFDKMISATNSKLSVFGEGLNDFLNNVAQLFDVDDGMLSFVGKFIKKNTGLDIAKMFKTAKSTASDAADAASNAVRSGVNSASKSFSDIGSTMAEEAVKHGIRDTSGKFTFGKNWREKLTEGSDDYDESSDLNAFGTKSFGGKKKGSIVSAGEILVQPFRNPNSASTKRNTFGSGISVVKQSGWLDSSQLPTGSMVISNYGRGRSVVDDIINESKIRDNIGEGITRRASVSTIPGYAAGTDIATPNLPAAVNPNPNLPAKGKITDRSIRAMLNLLTKRKSDLTAQDVNSIIAAGLNPKAQLDAMVKVLKKYEEQGLFTGNQPREDRMIQDLKIVQRAIQNASKDETGYEFRAKGVVSDENGGFRISDNINNKLVASLTDQKTVENESYTDREQHRNILKNLGVKDSKNIQSDYTIDRQKLNDREGPISGLRQFLLEITGSDPKKGAELGAKAVKENAGDLAQGGAVGAILGTIFPLGGPLMGAVVGAAVNTLRKSSTFNNYVFGTEVTDENGNKYRKDDGLLSPDTVKMIEKYAPDMKKFGTIGAVAGMMTPLGPLGGAMIGAAGAIAKNNTRLNRILFGDSANGKKGVFDKNKIKKMFPHLAIGAISGMLLGPFGILGNAALGSAAGMLTTTESFKKLMLGSKGRDGIRRGGLAGVIKREIVNPIRRTMDEAKDQLGDWFKNKLFNPVAEGLKPVGRVIRARLEEGASNLFGRIEKMLNSNGSGNFVTKWAGKIFKGVRENGGFIPYLLNSAAAKGAEGIASLIEKGGQSLEDWSVKNGHLKGYDAETLSKVFARNGESSSRTIATNAMLGKSEAELAAFNDATKAFFEAKDNAPMYLQNKQNEEINFLRNDLHKMTEAKGMNHKESDAIAALADSIDSKTFANIMNIKDEDKRNKFIESIVGNTNISKENRNNIIKAISDSAVKHSYYDAHIKEAQNGTYQDDYIKSAKEFFNLDPNMSKEQVIDILQKQGMADVMDATVQNNLDKQYEEKQAALKKYEETGEGNPAQLMEANNEVVDKNTEAINSLTESLKEFTSFIKGETSAKDLSYNGNIASSENIEGGLLEGAAQTSDFERTAKNAMKHAPEQEFTKSFTEKVKESDGVIQTTEVVANSIADTLVDILKSLGTKVNDKVSEKWNERQFNASDDAKLVDRTGTARNVYESKKKIGKLSGKKAKRYRQTIEANKVHESIIRANQDMSIGDTKGRKSAIDKLDNDARSIKKWLADKVGLGETYNNRVMKKIAAYDDDERESLIRDAYKVSDEYGDAVKNLIEIALDKYSDKEEENYDEDEDIKRAYDLEDDNEEEESPKGYAGGTSALGEFFSKAKEAAFEGGKNATKEHLAKTKESAKEHLDNLNPFSSSKSKSTIEPSATPAFGLVPPDMIASGSADGSSSETEDERGAKTKEVATSEGDLITYVKAGQDGSWTVDNTKDNQRAEAKLAEKRELAKRQTTALEAIAAKLGAMKATGKEKVEQGKGLLDDLLDFAKTPFKWLGGAISGAAGFIGTALMSKVITPLKEGVGKIFTGLKTKVSNAFSGFAKWIGKFIPEAAAGIGKGIINVLKKNKVIAAALGIGGALFGSKVSDAFDTDEGYKDEVNGYNSRDNGLGHMTPQEQKLASEMVDDGKSAEEINKALHQRRMDMAARGEKDEVKGDKAEEKFSLAKTIAPWATGAVGSLIGRKFGHKNAGFILGSTLGDQAVGIANGEAPSLTGAAWDIAQNAAISKGIDYIKNKATQDFAEGAGNNASSMSKVWNVLKKNKKIALAGAVLGGLGLSQFAEGTDYVPGYAEGTDETTPEGEKKNLNVLQTMKDIYAANPAYAAAMLGGGAGVGYWAYRNATNPIAKDRTKSAPYKIGAKAGELTNKFANSKYGSKLTEAIMKDPKQLLRIKTILGTAAIPLLTSIGMNVGTEVMKANAENREANLDYDSIKGGVIGGAIGKGFVGKAAGSTIGSAVAKEAEGGGVTGEDVAKDFAQNAAIMGVPAAISKLNSLRSTASTIQTIHGGLLPAKFRAAEGFVKGLNPEQLIGKYGTEAQQAGYAKAVEKFKTAKDFIGKNVSEIMSTKEGQHLGSTIKEMAGVGKDATASETLKGAVKSTMEESAAGAKVGAQTNNIVNNAKAVTGEAAEKAEKGKSIASKLASCVKDVKDIAIKFLTKQFGAKAIPFIPKIEKVFNFIFEKVSNPENAVKLAPKFGASGFVKNFINFWSWTPIVMAGKFAFGFWDGWSETGPIMKEAGLKSSSNPSLILKIISGLVHAIINFIPYIGMFIPTSTILKFCANTFKEEIKQAAGEMEETEIGSDSSSTGSEESSGNIVAPNGLNYSKNDIDYLTSNGMTKDQAIQTLSTTTKYTQTLTKDEIKDQNNVEEFKVLIREKLDSLLDKIAQSLSKYISSDTKTAFDSLKNELHKVVFASSNLQSAMAKFNNSKQGNINSSIYNYDPDKGSIINAFLIGNSKTKDTLDVNSAMSDSSMKTLSGIITSIIMNIPFLSWFVGPKDIKSSVINSIGASLGIDKNRLEALKKQYSDIEKSNKKSSDTIKEDQIKESQGGKSKITDFQYNSATAGPALINTTDRVNYTNKNTEEAKSTWQSIKDTASSVWEGAKSTASDAWEGAKNFGSKVYNKFFGDGKYGQNKGLLLQSDPRFGDKKQENCLSFAMANLVNNKYGGNISPTQFMKEAEQSGDKVDNDGTKPSFVQKALGRRGYDVRYVSKNEAKSKMEEDPNTSLILEGSDSRGVNSRTPFAGKHYVAVNHMSKEGKSKVKSSMNVMDSQTLHPERNFDSYNTDEVLNHSDKIIAITPKHGKSKPNIVSRIFKAARSKFGGARYGMGEDPIITEFKRIAAITAKRVGSKHPELFFAQLMLETGGPNYMRQSKWQLECHNYGGFTWYEGMGPEYKGPPRTASEGGFYAKFKSDSEFADMWYNKVFASYAADLAKAETPEDYARVLKQNGYYTSSESKYAAGLRALIRDWADELQDISKIDVSNISTGTVSGTSTTNTSSTQNKPLGFFGAVSKLIEAFNPFNFDISNAGASMQNAYNDFRSSVGKSKYGMSKFGMGTAENRDAIWNWLRDPKKGGLNNAGAAGIMGSMQQESTFNPKINQGSMAETDDAPPPSGEGQNGYGLCQWTGSRTQKLIDYAKSKGTHSGDLETQLEFMMKEAEERGVWSKMAKATSPVEASEIWTKEYEGCGVVGNRHKYAQEIFDTDGKGSVGESSYKGRSTGSSGGSQPLGFFGALAKLIAAFNPFNFDFSNPSQYAQNALNTFRGGSSGGAGASGSITSGDNQGAAQWAENNVGTQGFGNNGCTEFVKRYLQQAKNPLGTYMEDGSQGNLMWVPTLWEWAKKNNVWKDASQGGATGDVALINTDRDPSDPDHVVIATGNGDYWGNSSSKNKIVRGNLAGDYGSENIFGYIATGGGQSAVSTGEATRSKAEIIGDAGSTSGSGKSKFGKGAKSEFIQAGAEYLLDCAGNALGGDFQTAVGVTDYIGHPAEVLYNLWDNADDQTRREAISSYDNYMGCNGYNQQMYPEGKYGKNKYLNLFGTGRASLAQAEEVLKQQEMDKAEAAKRKAMNDTVQTINKEVAKDKAEIAQEQSDEAKRRAKMNATNKQIDEESDKMWTAPNGLRYSKNDVSYLKKNGYTQEQAFDELAKTEKYTKEVTKEEIEKSKKDKYKESNSIKQAQKSGTTSSTSTGNSLVDRLMGKVNNFLARNPAFSQMMTFLFGTNPFANLFGGSGGSSGGAGTSGANGSVPSSQYAEKILQEARSHIGKPYVMGANGPDAYDCSSHSQKSYAAAGLEVPRCADDQFEFFKEKNALVNVEQAQPGDMIFFANTYPTETTNNNGITHVGIVSAPGDATSLKTIHASSSKGVIECSLSGWLQEHLPPGACIGSLTLAFGGAKEENKPGSSYQPEDPDDDTVEQKSESYVSDDDIKAGVADPVVDKLTHPEKYAQEEETPAATEENKPPTVEEILRAENGDLSYDDSGEGKFGKGKTSSKSINFAKSKYGKGVDPFAIGGGFGGGIEDIASTAQISAERNSKMIESIPSTEQSPEQVNANDSQHVTAMPTNSISRPTINGPVPVDGSNNDFAVLVQAQNKTNELLGAILAVVQQTATSVITNTNTNESKGGQNPIAALGGPIKNILSTLGGGSKFGIGDKLLGNMGNRNNSQGDISAIMSAMNTIVSR